jgi:hypothetical protein
MVAEAEAQLKVARAFAEIPPERRERVLRAVALLLEADAHVPGILDQFTRSHAP